MKHLILSLCLLASVQCFAQSDKALSDSIPKVNGNYEYEEVVKVDSSFKKDDLYKNAKLYFVNSFKSAKDVIQYDEKSEGRIIGKGLFKETDTYNAVLSVTIYTWDIYYSTEIICKDGRYKFRMYDINITQSASGAGGTYPMTLDAAFKYQTKGSTKKLMTRLLNKTMSSFRANIESLKENMIKSSTVASKSDF